MNNDTLQILLEISSKYQNADCAKSEPQISSFQKVKAMILQKKTLTSLSPRIKLFNVVISFHLIVLLSNIKTQVRVLTHFVMIGRSWTSLFSI